MNTQNIKTIKNTKNSTKANENEGIKRVFELIAKGHIF